MSLLIAGPAGAEVRTATINDPADDSSLLYDIEQVRASVDREASRAEVTVRLHNTFAEPNGSGGGTSLAVWLTTNPAYDGQCSARGSSEGVGDTYISIQQTGYGETATYQATTNVKFRQNYSTMPVAVSDDRREATVAITDELYQQANLRCLAAVSSGRGAYDASRPGGGASIDNTQPVWFDGFAPAPPPPSPGPASPSPTAPGGGAEPPGECEDGEDNNGDGDVDFGDYGCTRGDRERRAPFRMLTLARSRGETRRAVGRRLGGAYTDPTAFRAVCRRRWRRTVTCRGTSFAGDSELSFRTTIRLTGRADAEVIRYRLSARVVNGYCRAVTPERDCDDRYRFRGARVV